MYPEKWFMLGDSVRGRGTLKCKVRAFSDLDRERPGQTKLFSWGGWLLLYQQRLTNLKFWSYMARQFHTTAFRKIHNNLFLILLSKTHLANSFITSDQGHITNSPALQHFFSLSALWLLALTILHVQTSCLLTNISAIFFSPYNLLLSSVVYNLQQATTCHYQPSWVTQSRVDSSKYFTAGFTSWEITDWISPPCSIWCFLHKEKKK